MLAGSGITRHAKHSQLGSVTMENMKFVVLLIAIPALALAQDFDVLIRGGRIVDGAGNPSFIGDLGIRGGKIAAMGPLRDAHAGKVIDAKGLIVAPGFIDIHNHSDYSLLLDGNAQSMIRQGVTSMILGEGESAAPVGGKQQGNHRDIDWTDFRGYFSRLLKQGISTNIGSYVGSSQIWTYVHGEQAGPPSAAELTQMQSLVRDAMRQGALGVSSSLSGPPGAWIDTDTLVAMCKAASEFGGLYSTHMRTEGQGVFESVAEAIAIGTRAGVPVDIIHLKLADHKLWGKMPELVASIEHARAEGHDVTANVYPYRAGQNNLSSIIPPWAHEGGTQEMLRRLKDPALHTRLVNEIEHGIPGSNWYDHYTATGSWEGMLLVSLSNPEYKKYEGHRMNEVVQALGGNPIDVLFKVLEDNNGSVPTIYFHHDENDMRYALRQPFVSIGSDGYAFATEGPTAQGHPHPRSFGTFARVLGRYVRDEKVITLEQAVRKMTSANAVKIHIYDRGLLRPGMWADVAVFDPAKIIDQATWENPRQYATGVKYVLVNGKLVIDQEKHTGARPGAILYGPGIPQSSGQTASTKKTVSKHEAAEWVIRQGGSVQIAGRPGFIKRLSGLPDGDVEVVAVDLVGTTADPKELVNLSGLTGLRELLLPGTSFNTGAGSTLDANADLAALSDLHNLEKLWFSLHFLSNINVQDKGLDHLKGLTQLKELRLAQTKVLGPSLAPFVNLQSLDLNETRFKDDGMKYLRGMTHLRRLSLRSTLITDAGLENIADLQDLESLDLYGTKITDAGLHSLQSLKKLRNLNLLGSRVTDQGVPLLEGLSNLENLNLYRTELTNAGLDRLRKLKKLASLDLRYTRVTASGVEAFHAAQPNCEIEFEDNTTQSAQDVSLRQTKPAAGSDEAIAAWIAKLGGKSVIRENQVREADLSRTPISDAQLAYLEPLSGLEKLSLASTETGDLGAKSLAKLTHLHELNLSDTLITDQTIASLAGLTELNRLLLNNTQVQGSGFGTFGADAGHSLTDLELAGAPVSDEGLHSIASLKSLRFLRLSYTNVTDAAAADLASLPGIERLDLSSTDVGDALLEGLKGLGRLTELKLNYSRITNNALKDLAGFSKLEHLEIARTRVSDQGMAALTALHALKRLNLDYTTVSDSGLATIREALPDLIELRMDSSGLTDASVDILRGMRQLRTLNLYHTLVTEKGFETLKKELPQCDIIFDRDSALPNRRHS
jgi:N-acyl-D-amino-acid deacylase